MLPPLLRAVVGGLFLAWPRSLRVANSLAGKGKVNLENPLPASSSSQIGFPDRELYLWNCSLLKRLWNCSCAKELFNVNGD